MRVVYSTCDNQKPTINTIIKELVVIAEGNYSSYGFDLWGEINFACLTVNDRKLNTPGSAAPRRNPVMPRKVWAFGSLHADVCAEQPRAPACQLWLGGFAGKLLLNRIVFELRQGLVPGYRRGVNEEANQDDDCVSHFSSPFTNVALQLPAR